MNKGKLIVIEGLDGSGKATQAAYLAYELQGKNIDVKQVTYPNYQSESSALVRMYLAGAFGSRPDDVNAYAASSFYAVDRFADYKMNWESFYREGGVIIADRYTTSNAVHQCSKLEPGENHENWDSFLDWLFRYEYDEVSIPAPDAVVYLRVDPEVSQKLMTGRYKGDESRKDIHERDMEYLNRSRAAAEYCAKRCGWRTVECVENGELLPIAEITRRVVAAVEDLF